METSSRSETTLVQAQEAVRSFHAKFGFPRDAVLCDQYDEDAETTLSDVSAGLSVLSRLIKTEAMQAQADAVDIRLYRAHLLIEELSEVIVAMANRDEIELADGLGDLTYVVLGTAVAFSIPVAECFDTIHVSNMSKTRGPGDERMKSRRHEGYVKPAIGDAIEKVRGW